MTSLGTSVLWLLVLLATVCTGVQAGNCSSAYAPAVLRPSNGGSVLYLYGDHGILYSAVDGRNVSESFVVQLNSLGFAERTKQTGDPDGSYCVTPDMPYENKTAGGRPVSELIKFYDIEDMDCYVYTAERYLNGVRVRGAYVDLSSPLMGDFRTTQAFEFADAEILIFPNNDTTNTGGLLVSYHYKPNTLKITMNFSDFPWSVTNTTSNTTAPYMSVHVSVDIVIPPCVTGYFADTINTTYATFTDGHQSMGFSFDKAFLIDGAPFANRQKFTGNSGPFDRACGYPPIPFTWKMGIPFCAEDGFGAWKEALYDPELTSLFLVQDSTPNGKAMYPLIVGMVFLGIIVLVGVFLLLVFFVPVFTKTFMPSRMRHNLSAKDTHTTPKSHVEPSISTPDATTPRTDNGTSASMNTAWKTSSRPIDSTF